MMRIAHELFFMKYIYIKSCELGSPFDKTALNVLPVFQSPVNDPPGADENSLESDDVYGTGDKDD